MERISIQEITAVLVLKYGLKKKDAERFGTTIFEVVKDGLESDRLVKIKGLGTFKVIDIEARESVNVNTGERVLIEGHGKVTFTPDATMKELVNKPFSQFETVVLNDGVEFDDMPADDDDAPETEEPVAVEEQPSVVEPPVVEEPPVLEFFSGDGGEEPTEVPPTEVPPIEEPPIEEPPVEVPLIEVTSETEEEVTPPEPEQETTPQEPEEEEITNTISTIESEEETMNTLSENDYQTTPRSKVILWLVIALLACIASFIGGYFVGLNRGKAMMKDEVIEVVPADTLTKDTLAKDSAKADTAKIVAPKTVEPKAEETKKEKEPKKVEEPKKAEDPKAPAEKPVEKPAKVSAETPADDLDKYGQKDARVRTGAYRIVGTDHEVKVKAGETIFRITQRTLGPGMECYIEAYNDLKNGAELQAGQTLKIPKL